MSATGPKDLMEMETCSPEDQLMKDATADSPIPQEISSQHVYKKKDSAVDLSEPMRIDNNIPDQQPQQAQHELCFLTSSSSSSPPLSKINIMKQSSSLSSVALNLTTSTTTSSTAPSSEIARFYFPKSDAKKLNEDLCKSVKVRLRFI